MNIVSKFKKKGYFIVNLNRSQLSKLNSIKKKIYHLLKKKLKVSYKETFFFNNFHEIIDKNKLNSLRLNLYNNLNKKNFNIEYYNLCSNYIQPIVGTENVIQKKINLSIQMPNDDSSLLPVHSDTWAGDSPYEIVIWIPLVDCKKTQSMFILPRDSKNFKNFNRKTFNTDVQIMKKIKKDIKFINIKYGQILIFSQNLPHGNIVNKENKTRWSFNARVKSLMSPYSSKGLLDFFDVVKFLPATEFGIDYEYPKFK
tara:strand:- start:1238 stop:2002 length:765 start_codon:yes stop_codon:yes gene_type:complete